MNNKHVLWTSMHAVSLRVVPVGLLWHRYRGDPDKDVGAASGNT